MGKNLLKPGTGSRRGARNVVQVRVKAWVRWPDRADIGPGRAALLRAVDASGSIGLAASQVGIAYRTAWNWIQAMNAAATRPLVVGRPGGAHGGGATLTPVGRAVVAALDALSDRVDSLARSATSELTAALEGVPADRLSHRPAPRSRSLHRTKRT